MVAPTLSLALVAIPTATVDMTALTGGSQALTAAVKLGFNGSDWSAPSGNIYTGVYPQSKENGGGQLYPQFFGSFNNNDVYGVTDDGWPAFTQTDGGGGSPINSLRVNYDSSAGLTRGFDLVPDATRNLHKLYWYGRLDTGVAFTVTATLSDGSKPPQSLVLPANNTKFGFLCTFSTLHDDAKLQLRFLKTGTGSGQIYMAPTILLPSVPRARPKSS